MIIDFFPTPITEVDQSWLTGVDEALWVGYRNSENGFVGVDGNPPAVELPWDQIPFPGGMSNPEPNGGTKSCARYRNCNENENTRILGHVVPQEVNNVDQSAP